MNSEYISNLTLEEQYAKLPTYIGILQSMIAEKNNEIKELVQRLQDQQIAEKARLILNMDLFSDSVYCHDLPNEPSLFNDIYGHHGDLNEIWGNFLQKEGLTRSLCIERAGDGIFGLTFLVQVTDSHYWEDVNWIFLDDAKKLVQRMLKLGTPFVNSDRVPVEDMLV